MEDRSLRILVVDDDQATRESLRTAARQSCYEVFETGDGRNAPAKLNEIQPDILVVHHATPGMDGIELARTVRNTSGGHQPYIILLAGLQNEDRLLEALDAGVDDFIGKPFSHKIAATRLRAGERIVRLQRANKRHIDELHRYSREMNRSNTLLRELALTDPLTGLPNRHQAMERMQQEWAAAQRHGLPLSCLVIDLDSLKQINQLDGHERGDVILKTMAATMRRFIRTQDIACRIGGDEFLIICPGASLDEAMDCGERLIGTIGSFGIRVDGCPLGLSIGAAEHRLGINSAQELVSIADRGVLHAKRQGKNQLYSEQEKRFRRIRGLSKVCQHCKVRGRSARKCSPLSPPPSLPENSIAA